MCWNIHHVQHNQRVMDEIGANIVMFWSASWQWRVAWCSKQLADSLITFELFTFVAHTLITWVRPLLSNSNNNTMRNLKSILSQGNRWCSYVYMWCADFWNRESLLLYCKLGVFDGYALDFVYGFGTKCCPNTWNSTAERAYFQYHVSSTGSTFLQCLLSCLQALIITTVFLSKGIWYALSIITNSIILRVFMTCITIFTSVLTPSQTLWDDQDRRHMHSMLLFFVQSYVLCCFQLHSCRWNWTTVLSRPQDG